MTKRQRLAHILIDLLRWTGIRNRLRCPRCSSIGTYKPHGGLLDREDKRRVPRWLCKWCGYYVGPEGIKQATVDRTRGVWTLVEDTEDVGAMTPADALASSIIPNTWPWRG